MDETDNANIYELPQNWVWTHMNSVAELLRGVSYDKSKSSRIRLENYIPILRATNVNRTLDFNDLVYVPKKYVKDEQFVREMDIIIAMSSGSKDLVGKAAQATEDFQGAFGTFCGLIRPINCINKKLLGYFFQSPIYRDIISKLSIGININNLRRNHIEELNFPLPPLNEQNRIVSKLEGLFTRLDAGIDALTKAKILLKHCRQSLLKYAFEGKLTERWRVNHKDEIESGFKLVTKIRSRQSTETNGSFPSPQLFKVPDNWVWTTIGTLFDVKPGSTPSRTKQEYWAGNIPWVSSSEVANRDIYYTREKISQLGLKNSSVKLHPPGTVLLAMIGEGKTRGQTAILKIPATTNQNVAAILCAGSPIPSEYLFIWFMYRYSENRSKGSGGMQQALNAKLVKDLPIPLPSLLEQNEIIKRVKLCLSMLENTEKDVEKNLRYSASLRKSIIRIAFEGKLVPQDPNDEPASLLLNRITEEKLKIESKVNVSKRIKSKSVNKHNRPK